ncbi:MAG: 30S ribosomal protein S16 [Cytophagales bacterium]|nr:30S ribosomal protein S16 [Cytophagales bacterium]
MAVRIRLARRGRKKLALYDIVAADAKAPRDGRYIEKIGTYNPNTSPSTVHLNEDSALKWLFNGAQPTNTTKSLLSSKGILLRKNLQIGVKKGAITQEEADKSWEAWKREKEAKVAKKMAKKAKIAQEATKTKATPKEEATAQVEKTEVTKPSQQKERAEKATTTEKQSKAKTQEVTSQEAPKTKSQEEATAQVEKTEVAKPSQQKGMAEKATTTETQSKAKTQEVTSQEAPKTKSQEEAKEVSSTARKARQDVPTANDKESMKETEKVKKDTVEEKRINTK